MAHIVVTGAAGILGAAVARYLHEQGHEVTGIDLAEDAPDCPGAFIGGVDLTQSKEAKAALSRAMERKPINGLVNAAGGFRWETLAEGHAETWEGLYRLNVMTALNASQSALSSLCVTQGAIVNVGAAATLKAGAGMGAYTAAKSGIARLTEALAEELKGMVRVNAVLPSILDTPANRAEMGEADAANWVTPKELAGVIGFLLSPDASAVTGANIPVTGRV